MAKKILIADDDVMLADHMRTTFPPVVELFHTGEDRLAHLKDTPTW